MKKRIKNAKIYIAIIIISIIFVCLINLNNIKIILNNTQNNELIAKQEENIVKGSDYTEDTNFEEFVKKDGETYDFLNEEESTAQIASSESTEQTQVIKYTNDLDEVQHLFGKYQLNFTGSNSIPLNYIMISNGYKKTYNGKTGIIKNRIKENATATDYKNGEYLKDAFYSRLSKDSNYSWIAQFEDKLSIKSRDYETMPITTIDSNNNATGTKDQKNTALILKNSTGAELKATNDNSKIYKAYLVINTRDNRRKYNNCTVCDGTDFLKKHKGTTELEDLPCILEDYPVTLIGPNKKYITTKMQTVEMRKNPETCDEAMDIMGYIDITDFVKDEGYGMYYCVNIPFVYGYSYDDVIYHGYLEYDRYASWDIVVVEEDDTLPIRELNLKIGLANTRSTEAKPKEYNIKIGNNGVKSKSQGQVNGQILYALDGVDRTPGNVKQEIKLNEITDSGEKKFDKIFADIDNGERDTCGEENCIPIIRHSNFQITGAVDKNGVAVNYVRKLSDYLNTLKQNGNEKHLYMENPRYAYKTIYYVLKNKIGTDIELLDINQDNEFSAIKNFSNNLSGLSFGIETKQNTHIASTVLGLDYDIETPTYKTSIQTNIKENEIVISGESQRVSGDAEVINTTSTISIDDKFKITDNLNVKLYSEINGVEYQDTTATYTVDGNNIKIKWGLDSNENDSVVDYKTSINNSKEKGSYIRFEITGIELKEQPTAAGIVYNNNIVVSGTMTNGTTDINVDNFASDESEIKSGEVNVHHCLRANGIRPLKIEYQYDLIGKAYTTTVASDIAEQYELVETSENIDGYFEADKINVYYYYKYKEYPYTVNYLEKGSNKVIHEAKTTLKSYNYVVSSAKEKISIDGYNYDSADKDTLTIGTGENVINLYYTKRNDLSYTVNYLEKDTDKVLHEAKVVENKTFEDVVTSSDEIININGYNYDSADKDTLTIGTGENVINLYYAKRNDLSYTVNYLEKKTNKVIHEAKTQGNVTLGDVITGENEKIDIDGYIYESLAPENITIGTGENVINIYYTKRIDLKFKVNYLEKGSSKELHESKIQENMTYDDTIISEDQVIPIEGYNYDSADKVSIKITAGENIINLYYTKRNDLNYTVNYLEKDTDKVLHDAKVVENKTFEDVVTSSDEVIDIDGYNYDSVNPESLTITTGTNVINIYYTKRNDLSYTVNYLEKDTDKVLHDAKVVENKTFEEVVTSSNEVIDIDGYNYDSVNPESLKITTETNIINIYYTKRSDLSYTVNYLEKDTDKVLHDAKVVENKTFEEIVTSSDEVIDIDGYNYDSVNPESLKITTETNIINIYYTKRNDLSYTVNYLEKDTNKVLHTPKTQGKMTFESVVTSKNEVISIDGYNYNSVSPESLTIGTGANIINIYYTKKNDLSYTVNYLEKDTNKVLHTPKTQGKMTFESVVTSKNEIIDIEGYNYNSVNPESLTIKTGANVINIYYTKKNDLSYTVNYLEKDTNKVLHEAKVVENKTFEEVVTSSNEVIDIEGYNYNSVNPESLTIKTGANVINIYYTKKNDLSYTVNYLEKDTDKVLHDAKLVKNKTFEEVVTSSNEVIDIEGYNYNSVNPESLTITTGTNIINIYYTKKNDLSYTVNYLEKDTNKVLHTPKTQGKMTFESVVTSKNEIIDIDGYNYNSVNPESLTITTGTNVINIYYTKRNDLSYTVNYLEKDTDKVLHEAKVVENKTFEEVVTSSDEVIDIDGYNYDSVNPESLTIGTGTNVINIYYTKRNDLSYTVNYLEKDTDKVLHEAKVVENKTFEEVVTSSNEVIDIEGYNYNSVNPESLTITTGTNVINIYYTKKNDLSYTVNYLEKDTNKVLHTPKTQGKMTFESVVTSKNEIIDIDGYNYNSVSPESLTIGTGANIINIYYTKRNDLSYTVNYLEKDTDKVLHTPKTQGKMTFESVVTSKNEIIDIDGYNYNSVNPESLTITTGANVINIYYTKKNDLRYTVNYLEKDTDKVLHDAKLVENKTFEEVVTSSNEVIDIEGYNYNSVNPESLTITTGANVINIYYTKRNDLSYTVNYLEKETDKVLHEAKVVENKTFEDVVISSNEVIDIDGYNYDSVNPESLTITTGANVINIYYTKRNDLSYTVNYLEKDTNKVLHDTKVVENKTFEEVITSSNEVIDIDGYNYNSVNPESLTIKTGANVINIYYTKRNDLSYTVNYLEKETDKVLHTPKTQENVTFEEVVTSSDEVIDIDGYNYDSVNPESLTIGTGVNVITIYYTKRNDLSYTVNYLEKDTDKILHDAKLVENKTFEEVVISSNEVINIYGYNYDSIDPEELIIKTNNNIINIYYVKKDTAVVVKHYEEGTTNKLSETVTIQGKVFDEYKTEQATDIPEKYEFSYVEGNTTGTMTEEKVEVIYYYKVKDSKLTVRYVDKNHDTEIIQADETIGKVDDKYETQAREIEGYTLVGNSENTEGTLKVEATEVIYYYKKNTAVQVKYIDIDTNEELSQETIEGLEGDEYQTESKNFERYVLVKETDNTEGTMKKDEIIVIYYYEHQSKGVIEKHIDITTNEILENKVYTGKYGTPYTTKAKTIEGYDVVKERLPENAEGTMIEDVIEVNYYYIAKANINVEYIDRATGKSLITSDADQITIIGHEGDTYQTEEKTFEGYDLIEIVGNTEGTMIKGETTVKYIYARPTKVIVRYIDQITGENLITSNIGDDPITIIGHEGDAYQTEEKTITGYDLVKTSENTEGIMTKEDIEVTYYYIAKTKVIVNYIDRVTGESLITSDIEPITITGHEGDTYQTEEKTFAGYDLVKTSENTEGRMTKETIEVTYYYARPAKVKVNYLDIDTGKEIANSIEINGHEGDEYKTEAKEIKYYELKEEAKNKEGRMTVEVEGEIVNNLTEVNYYYKKLEFNFKLEKRIESIKVNGESREVKGEVGKVEIYKKELEKAKVEVVYKIRVINAGKIKGKADVMDIIPSGMTVKEESKERWKIEGMTATTSTGEIEAGKYEDIEIIMTWNNAENNLGDIENIAQITKTDNDAGFDDIDEKDDADGANVIITVSTGDTTYVVILGTLLIVLSSIAMSIVIKQRN